MRIISGRLGGRQIIFPKHLPVRPTTDFAKNGLFNILSNHFDFESVDVLDLFCGAGGISIEFASRACHSLISVDRDGNCVKFVSETMRKFEVHNARCVKSDALSFIERCSIQFDIVFADAPFDYKFTGKIPELVFNKGILREGGWLIVEHNAVHQFENYAHFRETRSYGNVRFSIFEKGSVQNSEEIYT